MREEQRQRASLGLLPAAAAALSGRRLPQQLARGLCISGSGHWALEPKAASIVASLKPVKKIPSTIRRYKILLAAATAQQGCAEGQAVSMLCALTNFNVHIVIR